MTIFYNLFDLFLDEKGTGYRPMDRPTDRRMDKSSYKDAWTHLKILYLQLPLLGSFRHTLHYHIHSCRFICLIFLGGQKMLNIDAYPIFEFCTTASAQPVIFN